MRYAFAILAAIALSAACGGGSTPEPGATEPPGQTQTLGPTLTPTASPPQPDEARLKAAWAFLNSNLLYDAGATPESLYALLASEAKQSCPASEWAQSVVLARAFTSTFAANPGAATPQFLEVRVSGENATVRATFRFPDGSFSVSPDKVETESWVWEDSGWRFDPGPPRPGGQPCQFGS